MHLKIHKKHKISWDKTRIIGKEMKWESRKIKEALFINALDPFGQEGKLMNLERGWELSPVWNMFNARIRREMETARSEIQN